MRIIETLREFILKRSSKLKTFQRQKIMVL